MILHMVFRVGWRQHKQIHFCLVHIDIYDDMVIIQANNTEDLIDEALIALGVPEDKICLGLLPPDARDYLAQQNRERPIYRDVSESVALPVAG
jgi:hypothetical protein